MKLEARFESLRAAAAALEELPTAEFVAALSARRDSIVRHHFEDRFNGSYRQLINGAGGLGRWEDMPILTKQDVARTRYDLRPATDDEVLFTSTSGTTSTAVTMPHSVRSIEATLGDSALRAIAAAGPVGPRHWGIQHQAPGVLTGSQLSMRWMKQLGGKDALVTATSDPLEQQLARAAAFKPWSVATAPGFLTRIANANLDRRAIRPQLVLYGGAALNDNARAAIIGGLAPRHLVGFYPTTDAGAIGVDPTDSGTFQTFSETHFVEILNAQGKHVDEGERGHVVVTNLLDTATPIIRYRIGDTARFQGWVNNRLHLAEIQRDAEAAIGSTLIPFEDISAWTPRLQQLDPTVAAVQLVRARSGDLDKPVVRVYCAIGTSAVEAEALRALLELQQLAVEIRTGEVAPPAVEFRNAREIGATFKIPAYRDETIDLQETSP